MNKTIIDEVTWARALLNIFAHPTYQLAIEIAVLNAEGSHIYLAGGKLYRSIIEQMYGYPARAECCDYDFVATQTKKTQRVPEKAGKNAIIHILEDYVYAPPTDTPPDSHSLKFYKKGLKVDVISLGSLPHILENKLPRTIESYFQSVPLDIQAIAIDFNLENTTAQLIGDKGQVAILNRRVAVNNQVTLDKHCELKGLEKDSYVRKKAKSVRFDWS